MFTKNFDRYVYQGEFAICNVDGFTCIAIIDYDDDCSIDDDDVHNTDQSITGCNDEQQKKLLHARETFESGDWWYGLIRLEIYKAGMLIYKDYLGGVEVNYPDSDNSHLLYQCNELLADSLDDAKIKLKNIIEGLQA